MWWKRCGEIFIVAVDKTINPMGFSPRSHHKLGGGDWSSEFSANYSQRVPPFSFGKLSNNCIVNLHNRSEIYWTKKFKFEREEEADSLQLENDKSRWKLKSNWNNDIFTISIQILYNSRPLVLSPGQQRPRIFHKRLSDLVPLAGYDLWPYCRSIAHQWSSEEMFVYVLATNIATSPPHYHIIHHHPAQWGHRHA